MLLVTRARRKGGAGEPKVNKVNKVYVAESATFGGGDFSGAKVRAALSSASGTGEFIVGPRRVHVENCINGKMKLLYKRSFMARVDRRRWRRRGGGGVSYVRAETPEHIFRHLIFIEPRTVYVRARLWKTLHCRRQPREPRSVRNTTIKYLSDFLTSLLPPIPPPPCDALHNDYGRLKHTNTPCTLRSVILFARVLCCRRDILYGLWPIAGVSLEASRDRSTATPVTRPGSRRFAPRGASSLLLIFSTF